MSEVAHHLATASLQGAVGYAAIWILLRFLPRLPAVWRVGLLRLALLKFGLSLLVSVPLPVSSVAAPHFFSTEVEVPEEKASVPSPEPSAPTLGKSISTSLPVRPFPWLEATWLIGFAGFTGLNALRYRKARYLLRSAAEVADPRLLETWTSLQSRVGVRRPLRLLELDALSSPVILGVGSRAAVLPKLFSGAEEEAQRIALAHELAHLRRGDDFWGCLGLLVQSAFWFHPLTWMLVRQERLEAEIAADALAREWLDLSPHRYAASLMTLLDVPVASAAPLPKSVVLRSTHEITRRFQALIPNRYSRSACRKASLALALPVALAVVPLHAEPPVPQRGIVVNVPQRPGSGTVLLPIGRSREDATRLATEERLNTGGSQMPPAAEQGVRRLASGGTKGPVMVANLPGGGHIELLGLSHIEAGRSRSWAADGTPLPNLLPFVPAIGIPLHGDFERQILLKYSEGSVKNPTGYVGVEGGQGDLPGEISQTDMMPVPKRIGTDRLVVLRQSFTRNARTGDLFLRYFEPLRPLATVPVRDGEPRRVANAPEAVLMPPRSLDMSKTEWHSYVHIHDEDLILTMNVPNELAGLLRISIADRSGKEHRVYSLGSLPEGAWRNRPTLPEEGLRKAWLVTGVSPAEVAQIRYYTAQQRMVTFRSVQLHPR